MDTSLSLHLPGSSEALSVPPGGMVSVRFGVVGTPGAVVLLRVSAAADVDAGFRIEPDRLVLGDDGTADTSVSVRVPKRADQARFFFQLVATEDGAPKNSGARGPSVEVRVERAPPSARRWGGAAAALVLVGGLIGLVFATRSAPTTTYWPDGDGDGYGTPSGAIEVGEAPPPAGYVTNDDDCNDTASGTFPGATELCNGLDENCDGLVDEGVTQRFYPDADGDGYGARGGQLEGCSAPPGSLLDGTDCDDEDPTAYPGAVELCNDRDDDCSGVVDDPYDGDGDGWRRDDPACPAAAAAALDCLDDDPAVHPQAEEQCNARDDDCDHAVDEDFDADGDGYFDVTRGCGPVHPTRLDCDDGEARVNPGQRELCNGLDDNCDGRVDELFDADGDGYLRRTSACPRAEGTEPDCDDARPEAHPGATEVCNAVDDDCDGAIDEEFDVDGDGYLIDTPRCRSSYPVGRLDCDDARSDAYPTAPETCNSKDDDCDGEIDEDFDRDADGFYGRAGGCMGAYVGGLDCDDSAAQVHPGATERCNGVDDDCNGQVDEDISVDADGDGHYSRTSCASPHDDCDDRAPDVHPGAAERCNGIDDNCDSRIDERFDADGDGWFVSQEDCRATHGERASDCDDGDPLVHPGQAELADGLDNNCQGGADEVLLAVTQTIAVCARPEIGQPEVRWTAPEDGPIRLAPMGAQPGSAIARTNEATGRCATIRCERAGAVALEVTIGRLEDHRVTVQCRDPTVLP